MNKLIGQLRAWQFREWLYALAFAVAVLMAAAAVLLGAVCATDWVYDRYADTPVWVKIPLTIILVFGTLGAAFLQFRNLRAPSIDDLAGKAEREFPELDHRLVTSIQLTRTTARTEGMSAQLIEAVVTEAGEMASQKRLASLADTSKLKKAALVFVPLLLVLGISIALFGNLLWVLVQRQMYLNVEIPRSTKLEVAHRELWPSGDSVSLHVRVSGPLRDTDTGIVLVSARSEEGIRRPVETYEMVFEKWEVENETALFVARLPPSSESFTFHARLHDGRTHKPGEVQFAPRPVVLDTEAYVQLPLYVDPSGKKRFERIMPQGEVSAHRDCAVRVVTRFSKPVKTANTVLLGRNPAGTEIVIKSLPMTLAPDGESAEKTFNLVEPVTEPQPRNAQPAMLPSAYRIEVTDENGFLNLTPPRRGISITPDDPPRVALLDELNKSPRETGPLDDYEIRGIPLRLRDKLSVGYRASSPLGLLQAHFVYRVNDDPNWSSLPLTPVLADVSKVGKFVAELGLFEKYDYNQSVEFYLLPSGNPDSEPSGLVAGGKYVFSVDKLEKRSPDGKGTAKLVVGDRVEFYIAVYDRKYALLPEGDRKRLEMLPTVPPIGSAGGSGDAPVREVGTGLRPPGISESRIKKIVSDEEFQAWLEQRERSKESLRRIEDIQRGIFGQRKPSAPGSGNGP